MTFAAASLVSDLNTVTDLDLSSGSLTTLMNGDFDGLGGLKNLDLSRNQLTAPPILTDNTNLLTLDLSNNRLSTAPDVSANTVLRILNLDQNQLTARPS